MCRAAVAISLVAWLLLNSSYFPTRHAPYSFAFFCCRQPAWFLETQRYIQLKQFEQRGFGGIMIITKFKLNGRYEIEKELGRGGLGLVYLARDTHLQSRPVVIKTLLETRAGTFDDSWPRKKFDEEIMALVRIKHPGVVGIYDMGLMPDGKPFFVMPYVAGESLRSAMHGREMELKRAAHIIRQLSSALSAAHEMGVIHRDLKPENVMLQTFASGEEFALLIDFGIATVKELQAGQHEQITKVAGTLPYMAPEQLRGGPVPASDVWALGVMAYEMVTGRLPFPADNMLALDDMQRTGVGTKPRELRSELPEAAQEVILQALNYDPHRRYPHIHEMGEKFLCAILESESPRVSSSEESMSNYPTELNRQTAPPTLPPLYELLQRCRNLFKELEEFTSPGSLRTFFLSVGLSAYEDCVSRATDIDLTHLLACLSNSGRNYRGQALVDLLALLALHYRNKQKDYQAQECEGLRSSLMQLFAQARK
jgi:serine/threonine protein kinase